MGMELEIRRDMIFDGAFYGVDILSGGNATPVPNAEDMSVDRLGGLFPPHVQHNIRRLASHPGEGLQRRAGIGHLAAVLIDKDLTELDHILGLIAIKTDGFDMFNQPLFAQIKHLLRGIRDFEQFARGFVHARIGGLRT
jgi:hypothetical protein